MKNIIAAVVAHNAKKAMAAKEIGENMARVVESNPVATKEQLSHEQRVVIREAEEIVASDEFFAARPQADTLLARNLFRHGYFRGYDKGQGML